MVAGPRGQPGHHVASLAETLLPSVTGHVQIRCHNTTELIARDPTLRSSRAIPAQCVLVCVLIFKSQEMLTFDISRYLLISKHIAWS